MPEPIYSVQPYHYRRAGLHTRWLLLVPVIALACAYLQYVVNQAYPTRDSIALPFEMGAPMECPATYPDLGEISRDGKTYECWK